MNQNNPFAKLGDLDQKLYQETSLNQKEIKAENGIGKQKEQKSGEDNFLLANQQTSKVAKKQTSKPTNLQTYKLANQQTSKIPLYTKEKKKYVTYLREDSILAIQVNAIQTKRKDHEVLQEAVDFYFSNKNK